MKITEPLEKILQNYSEQVKAGNDVVIGLKDGVIFLEKGKKGETPIIIKVEPIDTRLEFTLKDVFGE